MHLTNKKKNPKAEGKNFQTIMKGHLEKHYDGCKKLQKEDESKVKFILKKVQPLLSELYYTIRDASCDATFARYPALYRPSPWCKFAEFAHYHISSHKYAILQKQIDELL